MQKLKYTLVEKRLLELGLKIFTANDLSQIFGASKRASEAFLSYNARRGVLLRLKKGIYTFSLHLPHDFLIANKIYAPSYISLETAFSFYNLIPETVYAVTSVTTRKTNRFLTVGKEFVYHKIKTAAFGGYRLVSVGEERVYLATPEKAVADFVYFAFLGKKSWPKRFRFRKVNQQKVVFYLQMWGNPNLINFWQNLKNTND